MRFSLKDLGSNVRKLRIARESRIRAGKPMLQYELARLAGIPAPTLSNVEKGKYRNPTWNLLSKISVGMECDITQLFMPEEKAVSPAQIALTEMIEMIVKEKLESLLKEQVK
jgi:transcriptional regulator with XRE-family HTH domain